MITKEMRLENIFDGWYSKEINKLALVTKVEDYLPACRRVQSAICEMQVQYGSTSPLYQEYAKVYDTLSAQILKDLFKSPIRDQLSTTP